MVRQKAREAGLAPWKALLGIAFMHYMTGTSLDNIITIVVTFTFLLKPITDLFSVSKVFAPLEGMGVNLLPFKILFLLAHSAGIAMALVKIHFMGVLPNSLDDLLGHPGVPAPTQFSAPPL